MGKRTLFSFLALCALGGTIYLSLLLTSPPEALANEAPATVFSAGRAMEHLAFFGVEPRPMGNSPAHSAARDYLLGKIQALGLQPVVQDSYGVRVLDRNYLIAGAVENILVRLPGTDPTDAILLIAHYDSTPGGPGAGDNGSGVVTLLELMRTLQANPRLRQDVILLFTDGHEPGIIGTHAFVDQHAWAEEVSLVINMDVLRGGPAQAVVTIGPNHSWVEAMATSANRNSLISLPYHLFPGGDTDLIPFEGRGIPGATIRGAGTSLVHHTTLDLPESVDAGTIQHVGEQVLTLVQTLGNRSTLKSDAPDQTYFPVLGRLIHYPISWSLPAAIAAGFICVAALWYGFRQKALSLRGMGLAFLAFFAGLALSVVVVNLIWFATQALHPDYAYSSYRPHLSDDYLYVISFQLLTLSVITVSIGLVSKSVTGLDLAAGMMCFWLLAALATSIALPASSFLASWVLLFGSLALLWALSVRAKPNADLLSGLGFLAAALLATFLWLPTIRDAYLGGPMSSGFLMLSMIVGLTGLWLGAMLPILDWIFHSKRWLLPGVSAVIGAFFLIAGILLVGRDSPPPMVNSIGYWFDATSKEACWIGFIGGTRVDAHTIADRQAFFPETMDERQVELLANPIRRPYRDLFPEAPPFSVLTSEAPQMPYAGPSLEVVSDEWANDRRILDLHFTASMRDRLYIVIQSEHLLWLTIPHNERIDAAGVDEYWLRLDGMRAEGMEMRFEFSTSDPIQFLLVEEKTGLPSFPGLATEPPPGTMQSPGEFEQGVPADFTAIYTPVEVELLLSTQTMGDTVEGRSQG